VGKAARARSRVDRLSDKNMTSGWPVDADVAVRLARAGDSAAVDGLLGRIGVPFEEHIAGGLRTGSLASALRGGLTSGGREGFPREIARQAVDSWCWSRRRRLVRRSGACLLVHR
jgi:hypothetical protein